MRLFVGIAGLIILFGVLWEAFESIILPRRVTRPLRLARLFYRVSWKLWSGANGLFRSKKFRETHLSYYGPLSLLMLFATWASLLVLAFAMLHWADGSAVNTPGEPATFRTDLYLSGTTFFTLGLGDVTPRTSLARAITVQVVPTEEPTAIDDQRDPTTALIDAMLGLAAGVPERLLRRLDAAFDELVAQTDG